MLIRLYDRHLLDQSQFPGRLVIELDCGLPPRPECGIFSGQHDGFEHEEEMNQRIPGVPTSADFACFVWFEIVAPNRPRPNQLQRYHYVAITWNDRVYVSYPVATEFLLENHESEWYLYIEGFTIALPDYSPWGLPALETPEGHPDWAPHSASEEIDQQPSET